MVGCKRSLDLLDCSVISAAKKARKTVTGVQCELADKLIDISQSHERRPLPGGTNRCLTTSSRLFWFQQRRLLTGIEHMLLQGYTLPMITAVPKTVSNNDLKDIAGEGIALPCLGSIVWALKLTANFP